VIASPSFGEAKFSRNGNFIGVVFRERVTIRPHEECMVARFSEVSWVSILSL
jgi:hypothetical protein